MSKLLPPVHLVGVLVLCCASLAACGGSDSASSDGGSSSSSSSSSNDQNAARTRLQDCLREQGVEVGAPGGGGGGPGDVSSADREKIQEAMNGPCKKYQEEAFSDFNPDDPEVQDQIAKLTQCMRDEGVDVPDMNGGGGAPPAGGGPDQDDPEVRDALEKCQKEVGGFAGPGGDGQ